MRNNELGVYDRKNQSSESAGTSATLRTLTLIITEI